MKTVNVIEAVFFAALDKNDAQERAAYLDQACNGDPDLRRCVEKLLAAQPRVGEFLQAPAPDCRRPQRPTVDHASDERPGTILGPYKLLQEIGEGGMGTVWMAEQAEPVAARSRSRSSSPAWTPRQVLARFEAERQALALMDHPNIAKVLDAGATDAGRPVLRDGTGQGHADHRVLRQEQTHHARAARTVHPRLQRDPARAPEGHHPPRHQAVERAGRALRRQAGARR